MRQSGGAGELAAPLAILDRGRRMWGSKCYRDGEKSGVVPNTYPVVELLHGVVAQIYTFEIIFSRAQAVAKTPSLPRNGIQILPQQQTLLE
jgi:hypothetical protein